MGYSKTDTTVHYTWPEDSQFTFHIKPGVQRNVTHRIQIQNLCAVKAKVESTHKPSVYKISTGL
jgi:hypothetical protein